MSEFKGTKGKWINSSNAVHNEKGKCICITYENRRADALLISKAPEMLEMLKSFVNDFDNGLIDDFQIPRDRFEQLIREATEL